MHPTIHFVYFLPMLEKYWFDVESKLSICRRKKHFAQKNGGKIPRKKIRVLQFIIYLMAFFLFKFMLWFEFTVFFFLDFHPFVVLSEWFRIEFYLLWGISIFVRLHQIKYFLLKKRMLKWDKCDLFDLV